MNLYEAETKLWKVLDRLSSFFKGREGVSAAQPIAEPVLKAESEFQNVDEHDRSTKLDGLNVEDWRLENSSNVVDFLDSVPGNAGVSETERIIRAPSRQCRRRECPFSMKPVFRLIRLLTKS